MLDLKGTMTLGAGWELPCHFGRGELKSQILDKKEKLSPTFFALNYESKWVNKWLAHSKLSEPTNVGCTA